jgi:hypothetical protein
MMLTSAFPFLGEAVLRCGRSFADDVAPFLSGLVFDPEADVRSNGIEFL